MKRREDSHAFLQATLLVAANEHMIVVEHLINQLREDYDLIFYAIILQS
jgi:hypothetical protein